MFFSAEFKTNGCVFFKVKHYVGYILDISAVVVRLVWVKRSVWIGSLASYETSNFDHTHDLDLGVSRSFLAATKQLYEWFSLSIRPSVCLSVCPSVHLSVCLSVCLSVRHTFDYVPIIISSRKFQEILPLIEVMSMQKINVIGQRSRSQGSQPHLTVSGQ